MSTLSEEWRNLVSNYAGKTLTLDELVQAMGPRGGALLAFVLSLPFLLWVAVPGVSIVFGIIIMLIGVRISFQMGAWFPRFLRKKEVSGDKLIALSAKLEKGLKWVEKGVKPRLSPLTVGPFVTIFNGILLAFNGFLLSLPLLPGTNFTPALGAAFLSLGIFEEDGLFVLVGYVVSLLNILLYIILPIFGLYNLL